MLATLHRHLQAGGHDTSGLDDLIYSVDDVSGAHLGIGRCRR